MSRVIGPAHPGESLDEYVRRVVRHAGEPTDEEYERLATLLGFAARQGGDSDAT